MILGPLRMGGRQAKNAPLIPTNLVGQLVEPLLNNHPDQPIRNELELRPRRHLVPDHRLQLPDLEVARQHDVMNGLLAKTVCYMVFMMVMICLSMYPSPLSP